MLREEAPEGDPLLEMHRCHLHPHAVPCRHRLHQPGLGEIDLPDATSPVPNLLHLDVSVNVPDLERDREGPLHQGAGVHRRLHRALVLHLAVLRALEILHRRIKCQRL